VNRDVHAVPVLVEVGDTAKMLVFSTHLFFSLRRHCSAPASPIAPEKLAHLQPAIRVNIGL